MNILSCAHTNTLHPLHVDVRSLCLQELCLIRFHPATEEEEMAYVSLFSYFSSKDKFGVVVNNDGRIKDLYLIPLRSKDPLPSKLLPFDGPGKHLKDHTNTALVT